MSIDSASKKWQVRRLQHRDHNARRDEMDKYPTGTDYIL